ncbi:hypothetical protein PPERSA_07845 [Pseudocohnilembus persalinus]|uniref:Uncharacterized protein n=1 Tax=Pseudocohnilembus persalinus TaxID=266149 RepID=A0A0V0QC44_PSEPJ|nr:hypothetical protein PPERSA_07845 [Pseudocohnilembus persalinus]|eukprot:KRW99768.1 hypothetical protein PPERSA_07845 [Pseudocohnilembus persalinus]
MCQEIVVIYIDLPAALFQQNAVNKQAPLNSQYVGFKIQDLSPTNYKNRVKIFVGATGILEGSIVTNLPAFSNQEVKCYFDTGYLVCDNVGSLIKKGYEYFASFKGFYDSSLTFSTCSGLNQFYTDVDAASKQCIDNYGEISIFALYTNAAGAVSEKPLYNSLPGKSIPIIKSKDFIDYNGWADESLYRLGQTQIISFQEDKSDSTSSTPIALKKIMNNDNISVGIFPDAQNYQQILFFLNVADITDMCGAECNTVNKTVRMNILFNSKILQYEDGLESKGIDFAAYSGSSSYDADSFSCYNAVDPQNDAACKIYDQNENGSLQEDLPNENKIVITENNDIQFGVATFDCYQDNFAPASKCFLFQGASTSAANSQGIIALRQVKILQNFQSQMYADDRVLDFVITFKYGNFMTQTFSSATLINAYTLNEEPFKHIKVSYINYYSRADGSSLTGEYIPIILRIGGSLMDYEYNYASKLQLFFDDSMDISDFYEDKDNQNTNKEVGCSTEQCYYYKSEEVETSRDIWFQQRRLEIQNLPDLGNEFQILIPFHKDSVNFAKHPSRLIICFTEDSYTSNGVNRLPEIKSCYRVFGPALQQSLLGSISTQLSNSPVSSVSFDGQTDFLDVSTDTFGFQMSNKQDILPNSQNLDINFEVGASTSVSNFEPGSSYGAGITIASFNYNIFEEATGQLATPVTSSQSMQDCTKFSYKYNSLASTITANKKIHIQFCPYDDKISTAIYNELNFPGIAFKGVNFSKYFSQNLHIGSIIRYALSNKKGQLLAYRKDSQQFLNTQQNQFNACYSNQNTYQIFPVSTGNQRLQFSFYLEEDLLLDQTGLNGFKQIKVKFSYVSANDVSVSQPGITNIASTCYVVEPSDIFDSSCVNEDDTNQTYQLFLLTVKTGITLNLDALTPITVYRYIQSTLALTNSYYLVQVLLPVYDSVSSSYQIYGDDFTDAIVFSQCKSENFMFFSDNSLGNSVGVSEPVFALANQAGIIQSFYFDFQSESNRQVFLSDYVYKIDLGYLGDNNDAYCLVYQNVDSSEFVISSYWKSYSLISGVLTLEPKEIIENLPNIVFRVKCFGIKILDSPSSTQGITVNLKDSTNTILESGSSNVFSTLSLIPASTTFTLTYISEKFNTVGFESLYTIQMDIPDELNYDSQIYVQFPLVYTPGLNREMKVECLLGTNINIVPDADTTRNTYCEVVSDGLINVWLNNIYAANVPIYMQIFYIEKLPTSFYPTSQIQVSINLAGDISTNGFQYSNFFSDTAPVSIPNIAQYNDILEITDIQLSTYYVRNNCDLEFVMDVPLDTIQANNKFYVMFTEDFSDSYFVSLPIECELTRNIVNGDNYAASCVFISRKIMEIVIGVQDNNNQSGSGVEITQYKIKLNQMYTPNYLPSYYNNMMKLKVFTVDSNNQITNYALNYQPDVVTVYKDPNLIDFTWDSYNYYKDDQDTVYETFVSDRTSNIYIGYYKTFVILNPDDQGVYQTDFKFKLSGDFTDSMSYRYKDFTILDGDSALRFSLAAKTGSYSGVYTLEAEKTSGDSQNLYTQLPPLEIIVRGDTCDQVNPKVPSIEVPVGGVPLPIIIDLYNCIPVNDLKLSVIVSDSNLVLNSTISQVEFVTEDQKDTQLFVSLYDQSGGSSFGDGDYVTVSFGFTGTNAQNFESPFDLQLIYYNPLSIDKQKPIALDINNLKLNENKVTFDLQCDQPSTMFWAIGLENILLNTQFYHIEQVFVDNGGYQGNYTFTNDIYYRVYGVKVSYDTEPKTIEITNLKSESAYTLKYMCVNQLGKVSESVKTTFATPNNGAYLLKVTLYFDDILTYHQNNRIACALDESLDYLDQEKTMTEVSTYCGQQLYSKSYNQDDNFIKDPVNNLYMYYFYIQPNYTTSYDTTNKNARNILVDAKILTTIQNNLASIDSTAPTYPKLQQISYGDITSNQTPKLEILSNSQTFDSITVVTKLTKTKGFTIVGLKKGKVSGDIPTHIQLQQAKDSENTNLLQQDMRFTYMNEEQKFIFTFLEEDTLYTLFLVGTSDDPSSNALADDVQYLEIVTESNSVGGATIIEFLSYKYMVVFLLFICFVW